MCADEEIIRARQQWLDLVSSRQPQIINEVRARLAACKQAIDTLETRYSDLSYPVQEFRKPCEVGLLDRVSTIEGISGIPIPQIVVEFWCIVGRVTFVDLDNYRHCDFWERLQIRGRYGFGDGVHVDACDEAYVTYVDGECSRYCFQRSEGDEIERFHYDFAPDGYHKDDISGGAPYGFLSDDAWIPSLTDFRWPGYQRPRSAVSDPTDFLSYVRSAVLECAGFPGFLGNEKFEELRLKLTRGLPLF